MIEELYNKIDKFCNETDWSKYPTYEHALEEFIKEIVAEETKELEKENTELKEINEGYCRSRDRLISIGFPNFKDCKEYAEHLTKAKELIKNIIRVTWGEGWNYSLDWKVKAEHFFKDCEVEK